MIRVLTKQVHHIHIGVYITQDLHCIWSNLGVGQGVEQGVGQGVELEMLYVYAVLPTGLRRCGLWSTCVHSIFGYPGG